MQVTIRKRKSLAYLCIPLLLIFLYIPFFYASDESEAYIRGCPTCPLTGSAQFNELCVKQNVLIQGSLLGCGTITSLNGFSGPNSGGSRPGATGSTGANGQAGNPGAIGAPGNTGMCSCTAGITGSTGSQGPAGATVIGIPGVAGPTGVLGATGDTGIQGAAGASGICTCTASPVIAGPVHIMDTTQSKGFCISGSTSSTGIATATGALRVDGGVAIGGNLNVGGYINTCQDYLLDNQQLLSDFSEFIDATAPIGYNRTLSLGFKAGTTLLPPGSISANTFLGHYAGQNIVTRGSTGLGGFNTFVGEGAGEFINDGHHNIALGLQALGTKHVVHAPFQTGVIHNIGVGALAFNSSAYVEGNIDIVSQSSLNRFCNNNITLNSPLQNGHNLNNWIRIDSGNVTSYNASNGIAIGGSLENSTTGADNIGISRALNSLLSGTQNIAVGFNALSANVTGSSNVAIGRYSQLNTLTSNNNSIGSRSLEGSRIYANNVMGGVAARNLSGAANVVIGHSALSSAGSFINTVVVGSNAGSNLIQSTNNIVIASPGPVGGSTGESGRIRIGTTGNQTGCYIAGIYNSPINGTNHNVSVDSNGKLGLASSSRRYKQDITDMQDQGEKVIKLRPVNFHFKSDPLQSLKYGFIAEELRELYPELVYYDGEGNALGIDYQSLIPIMLCQLKHLYYSKRKHEEHTAALRKRISVLQEALNGAGMYEN